MARKSRKQIAVEEPIIESVSSEVFSTAIYARLSVENSGKSEKVDVIAWYSSLYLKTISIAWFS